MNAQPLFSILMPTLDRAELIDRAVNSVMAQSETAWELLVADDGSIDGTWPLLREWRQHEPRIRCWHHPNRGQSASRNRLLQHARAPWVAFLDSDDELGPRHLERHSIAIGAQPAIDVWISPMQVVGSPLIPCSQRAGELIHVDECIGVGMLVIRRMLLAAVGGFPDLRYAEESALLQRLGAGGARCGRLSQRTYVYHRGHADSLTAMRMTAAESQA